MNTQVKEKRVKHIEFGIYDRCRASYMASPKKSTGVTKKTVNRKWPSAALISDEKFQHSK
jgi:hypothetical protein